MQASVHGEEGTMPNTTASSAQGNKRQPPDNAHWARWDDIRRGGGREEALLTSSHKPFPHLKVISEEGIRMEMDG